MALARALARQARRQTGDGAIHKARRWIRRRREKRNGRKAEEETARMSLAEASCPACGGPITFKTSSSIVVVCEYCNSAIARSDKNLQDLGKVADLVDTGSPLDVGLSGVYQGVPFQLT